MDADTSGGEGIWQIYHWPIIVGSVSVALITTAVVMILRTSMAIEPIRFQKGMEASTSAGFSIAVDIGGAVKHPGMYVMPNGSRVDDVIKKAGGLSDDADLDLVGRVVNRAARVSDGAKIYVPVEGEGESDIMSHNKSYATQGEDGSLETGVLGLSEGSLEDGVCMSINAASSEELESINGIGPATAGKIIDGRPYRTLEELVDKKVLGSKTFEKLKPFLCL